MTVLTSTYGLTQGTLVVARVQAHNSLGGSDWSEANTLGALVIVKPHAMAMPTLGDNIALTQLEVEWLALTSTATGGAAIDSYEVQYDANTNGLTWTSLQGEDGNFALLLSITVNSLTSGLAYQFKVRAHNDLDWGDYSPVATFYTYDFPGAPTNVETSYNNMNIKISWQAPPSNGKAITAYKIVIEDSLASNFEEELSYCNGADTDIVAQLHCEIPLSVLRTTPFSLTLG